MSKLSRENTALKLKGAGDGIKNLSRSSERIPVPSSRKFTATMVRDESVQLKLKKVLDEIEAKQGKLKKAKTIAEITPTKSTRRKPKRQDVGSSAVLLHATPRPPADDAKEPPSGRVEKERRLELLVYHRMLLFVWRRCKTRLAMVSDSLRRRQDQINQLEKQVDCLKDLTHSECFKRGEVMGDCQRMESILQTVRMENNSLITEKVLLQKELNDLRNKLQSSAVDLENMKNEMNTKDVYLKRLEHDINKERSIIKKIKEENAALIDKVKAQDVEIKSQEEVTDKLNQALRDLENHLKECENAKKTHIAELSKLAEQYQLKTKSYECIRHELSRVCSIKDEMRRKIENLEDKLVKASYDYEAVIKENESLKKKKLWKNTKEFLQVSWAVLQNAAYLMLPAL